ncbi:MAG: hypothetical protein WBP31_12975 [Chitinophagales bacterium]|jgi:hypothetical protein|nr:hypothetical protein [Bacteroidota bacterium]MBK9556189.1 hypothetical protein [Bacteroidota bacterium]MBL0278730.1 hypothetical protein [Bacteroidota bacterium]MBP9881487.1 hypothetical protein [Chitinophagales bacterium]
MFNRKNIEHIIARVVTQSALTLPVAYIQSIVFFNGKTKIADCSWEHFQQNGNLQFYDGDDLTSELIYTPTVVVHAVDMDGTVREFTTAFGNLFE